MSGQSVVLKPARIRSKLGGVPYFLARPHLWKEMCRRRIRQFCLRCRIGHDWMHASDTSRDEAQAWCRRSAVDTPDALLALGVKSSLLQPVTDQYAALFARAEARVGNRAPLQSQGGNLHLLFAVCEHLTALTVVETGVAFGWSSLAILLSLKRRRGARLFSTDFPDWKRRDDDHTGIVVPDGLRAQWTMYRTADRDALPRILQQNATIDVAHYDSDKTYEGRMWSYARLWAALRGGGVLITDDAGDNLAFRDFCQTIRVDPLIVAQPGKYQGIVSKPHAAAGACEPGAPDGRRVIAATQQACVPMTITSGPDDASNR